MMRYLFHGTTKQAWKRIQKEGLKPSWRGETYMTPDMELAVSNAIKDGMGVVLVIDVKGMKLRQEYSSFTCSKLIIPDRIRLAHKITKSDVEVWNLGYFVSQGDFESVDDFVNSCKE